MKHENINFLKALGKQTWPRPNSSADLEPRRVEHERDTRFVKLGRHSCEVRAGQYWRLDNPSFFNEFLEKHFLESRREAYYLMAIHEHLPRQARQQSETSRLDQGG